MKFAIRSFAICFVLAFTLFPATSAFTAAHPHVHEYYGTSTASVFVEINEDGNPSITTRTRVAISVPAYCANVLPVIATTIPPEVVRDDDLEAGVGGACFAFKTDYGDDTGSAPAIITTEQTMQKPVWIACVDVNGDGLCTTDTVVGLPDEVDVCWTGPSGSGGISLITSGSCSVYANPSAFNKNIWVRYVGAVTSDGSSYDAQAAIRGRVYLD